MPYNVKAPAAVPDAYADEQINRQLQSVENSIAMRQRIYDHEQHECSGFVLIVLQSAIYTKQRGDSASTTLQKRLSDHAKRALIHHLM